MLASGDAEYAAVTLRGYAAAEMLADLGVQPIMADASRALHERLSAGG